MRRGAVDSQVLEPVAVPQTVSPRPCLKIGCGGRTIAPDSMPIEGVERPAQRQQPMTIVVAALCEKRQAAVVATDRMESTNGLGVEIDIPKIVEASDQIVVSASFDGGAGGVVFRWMAETLAGRGKTASEVTEEVYARFEAAMHAEREAVYRSRFGVGMDGFRQMLMQSNVHPIQEAFNDAKALQFGASFLVAGADPSRMRLFLITAVNGVETADYRGTVAIGAWPAIPIASLVRQGYTASLGIPEAVVAVYEAKKTAEISTGVGSMTDLIVLQMGKPSRRLPSDQIGALDAIVEKRRRVSLSAEEAAAIEGMLACSNA